MEIKEGKTQAPGGKDQPPEEELAAYEKFRQRVSGILAEFHERINADKVSEAMDRATEELRELGEYSMSAITKARDSLRKDMASSGEYLEDVSGDARQRFENWRDKGGELWHDLAREAEYLMAVSRDKGGSFLAGAVKGIGEWSLKFGERIDEALVYHTGEITHGGEFDCLACGGKIHLKQAGRLPPCPKCRATDFRRS